MDTGATALSIQLPEITTMYVDIVLPQVQRLELVGYGESGRSRRSVRAQCHQQMDERSIDENEGILQVIVCPCLAFALMQIYINLFQITKPTLNNIIQG